MAKKPSPSTRSSRPTPAERSGVTRERFVRLYRLLTLLQAQPQSRESLARRLRLDVRGFYRDLELVRSAGIPVNLYRGYYTLGESLEEAAAKLPFPDPVLTLGETMELARGRGRIQRKLSDQVKRILGSVKVSSRAAGGVNVS